MHMISTKPLIMHIKMPKSIKKSNSKLITNMLDMRKGSYNGGIIMTQGNESRLGIIYMMIYETKNSDRMHCQLLITK